MTKGNKGRLCAAQTGRSKSQRLLVSEPSDAHPSIGPETRSASRLSAPIAEWPTTRELVLYRAGHSRQTGVVSHGGSCATNVLGLIQTGSSI
jgi:hypothetical protein